MIVVSLPFVMTGLYGFLDGNYLFFVTYAIASVITFALTYRDKQ